MSETSNQVTEFIENEDGSFTGIPTKEPSVCRLTIVESVYYRTDDNDPDTFESRFSIPLTSNEQCYSRKTKCGTKWQALDVGWLDSNCSVVIIENREGSFTKVMPTNEEREKATKKFLEIAYVSKGDRALHPPLLVRPQSDIRLAFSDFKKLRIRSACGSAQFTITAFPK
jgi:hypothetical protein